MKNQILSLVFIAVLSFSLANEIFASSGSISLTPSLESQMKRQEAVNKKAAHIERIQKKNITQQKQTIQKKSNVKKNLVPLLTIPPVPPQVSTPKIQESTNEKLTQIAIPGVNIQKVYDTWIGWYNDTRSELGLPSYTYDMRLNRTAHDWNIVFADGKGQNHHKRNPGDSYYDYKKITDWFGTRGVVGKVVNGATITENVGYGYYNCNSSDCTDELIRSMRSTFDFYMSERASGGVHYKSIVQPSFTKIGLDIIVVPSEKRYYLTVHYITEFE